MGKMGERLQVHPTSITSIIQRLDADGLVSRRPHPTDGRGVLAAITDRGREVVAAATSDLVDADFGLDAMSADSLGGLSEMLRPVRAEAGDFDSR